MKKITALLLAMLMCLSLAACGDEPAEESAAEPTATPAPTAEPAEATQEPAPTEEPAAEPSGKDIALSLIDSPVADLYAAIGEPESSEYASSCLIDGEDGVLYYDGFTVYTLRYTDGTETVYDVE